MSHQLSAISKAKALGTPLYDGEASRGFCLADSR